MNILEHINAGHYPKDDKGRALVPASNGETYTIVCTDKPGDEPIVGFRPNGSMCWFKATTDESQGVNLLPPPPRKKTVMAFALVRDGEIVDLGTNARLVACWRGSLKPNEKLVDLTGEYEEPWDAA